jgi:hypothetical protein
MAVLGAATPRRGWYRRPPSQYAALAVPFVMLAFFTVAIAGVAGSVRIGLILGSIELSLGAVTVEALSPLIMLRADEIRIWHGFRFTNIGMNEIAGIGMLYAHTAGYGGNWRLTIWRDDGSMERTEFTFLLGRSPRLAPGKGRWNWARQANYDPVASSEIPALSASRPAAVGRDLSERVLAAQGAGGQLATRHLEKHQHPVRLAQYTQVVAFWSPDGQSGHCR